MSAVAGHGVSVNVQACGKTFADGTRALEPATLDIARGETLVLLGPSGCGKTTMLRIIAGLELPDTGGKVLFDGKDMTSVPIERRNVGMVFQSYALFPNMSVSDNIGYGLKIGAANIIEAPIENGQLVLPGGRQAIGGDANMAAAVAMIRPETIRVVETGSAPLSGIIDSVSFIGDRQRLIVSGASSKLLTIDAPNTVQARAGERIGLLIS